MDSGIPGGQQANHVGRGTAISVDSRFVTFTSRVTGVESGGR
ncbi:MAG: hypothetical protein ABJA86_07645 [Nocardioidaceae bacterium]